VYQRQAKSIRQRLLTKRQWHCAGLFKTDGAKPVMDAQQSPSHPLARASLAKCDERFAQKMFFDFRYPRQVIGPRRMRLEHVAQTRAIENAQADNFRREPAFSCSPMSQINAGRAYRFQKVY